MTNVLLSPSGLPHQLPDYDHLTDADFREAIEVGIGQHRAELDKVATDASAATVENVLEAWERSGATLTRTLNAFWVAKAADTNDERDAISKEFAPKLSEHFDSIDLDPRLYHRLCALAERAEAGEVELDEQASHLLHKRLTGYERDGIHLDAAEQQRLKQINSELATLRDEFNRLLVGARNDASVLVTDHSELAGLDDDAVDGLREAATRSGLDGWLIEITNTTGQPILGSLRHRGLRERVFRASMGRGLGGEHDTRANLLRQASLIDERARLLGFPHHAQYVAEDGCAGSTEAVNDMLGRLARGALAKAHTEADELRARFASLEPGATFEPWDWAYVQELVRQERYQTDDGAIRPYLEFETVLTDGVFAAATAMYGLTFEPRPELVGYTTEARVYEVRDADGSTLGALTIDPYTRPTKQGGAWMTSITDQSQLLGDQPSVTNTCNFPKPAGDAPSLLTWDNVITLFHEFGHALHGLLSDVRYPSRSGTAVPRDFVEFPSQVNEIWAWEPWLLRRYARHHHTGEPMPAQLIDTLIAARDYGSGFDELELLAAMLLDQAWHQTAASDLPASVDDVEAFETAALERAGVKFDLVPPRYRSAYFSHIFGGDYSAAYYSYIWSEIMDADTVAWFREQGTQGDALRAAGERFRRELLGRGGSIDPMESYRRFRGADPDLKHLLERMGVSG